MLHIAETLSQLVLLDVFRKSERVDSDFKAWIANQDYFIDDDLTETKFSLRVRGDSFFKAISHDCDKFTRTSVETFAAIQQNKIFKKNSSWPIINAYYSSFFAAHAILRAFGVSFSQLAPQHMQKVFSLAHAFGKSGALSSLPSGFYRATYNQSTSLVSFEHVKDSHADLWNSFFLLIQRLIDDVPKVAALVQDKLDTMALLSEIKSVITTKGARGNWLSVIRNEVNYQGAYGAWYPYTQKYFDENTLLEKPKKLLLHNISLPIMDNSSSLNSAFNASLRITNLLIHIIKVSNKKFLNENYNFKNGSLKMINMLEA